MSNSRVEQILNAKISGSEYTGNPLSRVEKLLDDLDTGGGGGGGQIGPPSGQDFETDDVGDIMSVISTENGEENPNNPH